MLMEEAPAYRKLNLGHFRPAKIKAVRVDEHGNTFEFSNYSELSFFLVLKTKVGLG